ncbi:MAG TPA: hypothetical protein VK588_10055 [Chitinophagaceae bacterium]|nr:hypothetical protein [Chitinophagaceae bacterium]
MKIFLSISSFLLFICLLGVQGGLTSCTKDHTIIDTVTVVEKDTLRITDTLVTEAILTANPWKLTELRGVSGGDTLVYFRGGSNNTNDYTNEYYVFNSDHTGYEMDNAGLTHNLTQWSLSNSAIPKLTATYQINSSKTMILTWDNLRFKNKSLYYDEYYSNTVVGSNFHGQAIRIAR